MLITDYQSRLKDYLAPLSEIDKRNSVRYLAQHDLYFLLRYVLGREDIERQWLFDRCKEVQEAPDGYIDLWAREHYKSTIITFGKTIQDILADPEQTTFVGTVPLTFVPEAAPDPIMARFVESTLLYRCFQATPMRLRVAAMVRAFFKAPRPFECTLSSV